MVLFLDTLTSSATFAFADQPLRVLVRLVDFSPD